MDKLRFLINLLIHRHCDNQAAICIAFISESTKHIEANFHFIHEKICLGYITTMFTRSNDQLVGDFNKTLLRNKKQCILSNDQLATD